MSEQIRRSLKNPKIRAHYVNFCKEFPTVEEIRLSRKGVWLHVSKTHCREGIPLSQTHCVLSQCAKDTFVDIGGVWTTRTTMLVVDRTEKFAVEYDLAPKARRGVVSTDTAGPFGYTMQPGLYRLGAARTWKPKSPGKKTGTNPRLGVRLVGIAGSIKRPT